MLDTKDIVNGNVSLDDARIETMTITELTLLLRACGMKVGEMTLGAGIEQGLFPFAVGIRTDSDNRKYMIFKKLVHEWIAERAKTKEQKH